jgi:predicted DCC family thiol-disulfide oxidoreductase YuxK
MQSVTGILLFDGFCVLCSGFVRSLIKKFDTNLHVLAMQSPEGLDWLSRYNLNAEPDEVILLIDNSVLKGVEAVLFLMRHAGGWCSIMGKLASWCPSALLEWLYRRIANNRYLLFGKRMTCYRVQR